MTEAGTKTSPRRRAMMPIAVSLLFLVAGIAAREPLVNAASLRDVPGVSLRAPFWYVVFAPVSNVLDGLTLLSLPQIFSAFGFVCLVAIAMRVGSTRSRHRQSLPRFRIRDQIRFSANVVGAIIAVAGLGLLMPRSMAGLRIADPDLVTVDFHSHTSASHDGRPEYTPEVNREWHRKAGFDVAYVTDHHTLAGARAGILSNPRIAGGGTVLLPGLEYSDGDEHLLALGLDPATTTEPIKHEWHPVYRPGPLNSSGTEVPALLVLALPGNISTIPPGEHLGTSRLAAVELSDGSPRGIEQAGGDRAAITALSRRLGISLVSGSDNHGWGRAALAWTVMRIPGWRSMSPVDLDAAIRSTLLSHGASASVVVSRRLPPAASALEIAFTGPELAWITLRNIGWRERVSWVIWIWSGWGLLALVERRRLARSVRIRWSLPDVDYGTDARSLPE